MRPKPRIVQFLNSILHVLVPQKLHHSRAVLKGVGKTNITSLPHVILQILPRAARWQSCHQHSVLAASSWRSPVTSSATTAPKTASPAATSAAAPSRKLHPKAISVVVVAISCVYSIFSISGILKLHKGKRWSASILQVYKRDFAELIKQVLNIFGANVGRKITHVDSAIVSATRHDWLKKRENWEKPVKKLENNKNGGKRWCWVK